MQMESLLSLTTYFLRVQNHSNRKTSALTLLVRVLSVGLSEIFTAALCLPSFPSSFPSSKVLLTDPGWFQRLQPPDLSLRCGPPILSLNHVSQRIKLLGMGMGYWQEVERGWQQLKMYSETRKEKGRETGVNMRAVSVSSRLQHTCVYVYTHL